MASGELTQTAGYPVKKRMSARYEGTFAYLTLKDRMPRILTQVIDTINREEKQVSQVHNQAGTEDVKAVVGKLSEMRYQLQTNKTMEPIANGDDKEHWKMVFDVYRNKFNGENPAWFAVSWLFAECYMYRKIVEILRESTYLKEFDPFAEQKKNSFNSSLSQITSVGNFLTRSKHTPDSPVDQIKFDFEHLLLFSLWGNKMDLSMMSSVENYDSSVEGLSTNQAQLMRTNILADHTQILWDLFQLLKEPKSSSESVRRIDFVLDNAGFEIFSDFCFADWLLQVGLADKILFHFKQMPWFVSDALIKDLHSMLDLMMSSGNSMLEDLSKRWKSHVDDGSFMLYDHPFWTTSYEYAAMDSVAPDLFAKLKESHLVIFKGDLNYRKLLADRNWLYTEKFSIALGGFEPTNLCALRTLKADLVTGLSPGVAQQAANQSKDWMITGQYAVCQVNRKK